MYIIAHRGASEYEADNTLESVLLAIQQGADMVEIDVRATKDQILVLSHDDRLKRFDGKHKVSKLTYAELINFGHQLPKLSEIIEQVPEHIKLNLDLKHPQMDLALKTLLDTYPGIEKRIYFDSPNPLVLQRYHYFFPEAKTVLNSSFQYDPFNIGSSFIGRVGLHTLPLLLSYPFMKLFKRKSAKTYPHFISIHPHMCKQHDVEFFHSLQIGVFAAIVNSEKSMHRLIELGVDGIKTDKPDLLKQVLTSRS